MVFLIDHLLKEFMKALHHIVIMLFKMTSQATIHSTTINIFLSCLVTGLLCCWQLTGST